MVPPATILIQTPVAVVGTGAAAATSQKFVNYLLSPAAQEVWASKGYRPVISGVAGAAHFPKPPQLFTIEFLGGWKSVSKTFFEPESGIVTKIEQSLGVSTAK